ncbi:MAG TPA: hypothetical protein VIH42_03635 [Thermoguttaceae bacterium]
MSYLVYYRGLKVRVKTIQELDKMAEDIASKTDKKKGSKESASNLESNSITPTGVKSFWWDVDLANENRNLLLSLRDAPDGIATDDLAKAAGIDSSRIKYGIKSIYAIARKHKINGKMLIFRKEKMVGRPPKSIYQMKIKMREALKNIPPKELG